MSAASSRPKQRRRLPRFGLRAMLLLMIPLGLSFRWLPNYYLDQRPINWQPYSSKALDDNLNKGRAVLVNFRANWNPATLMHEKVALERPKVRRHIRSHGVVPLRADWSEHSVEIRAALQSLNQWTIPVVAIYPASSPNDPIVLSGVITEEQVLDALDEAAADPGL